MSAAKRTYVLPARMLLVPDELAPAVADLIQAQAQRVRRGEYGRPEPKLLAWLDDLEAVAADVRRSKLSPHRVVDVDDQGPAEHPAPRLIPTAEAAARLAVVPSTLTRSRLRACAREIRGRLWWPEDEIEAERSARAEALAR